MPWLKCHWWGWKRFQLHPWDTHGEEKHGAVQKQGKHYPGLRESTACSSSSLWYHLGIENHTQHQGEAQDALT